MSTVNEYSIKPVGQPDGYDYYIPFNTEQSRLLEKADYKARMAVMNMAAIIVSNSEVSSSLYERFYNRLRKYEIEYENLKSDISANIVLPFIDSIHGSKSNVSVKWVHSFKTPFIAVKYTYDVDDHSFEKDLMIGEYSAEDVGIDDSVISALMNLATSTQVDDEVFKFIARNYPDPDERQQSNIDKFTDEKDDRMCEYEELKASVTNTVNAFLATNGIGSASDSLQWNLNFASKTITITKDRP